MLSIKLTKTIKSELSWTWTSSRIILFVCLHQQQCTSVFSKFSRSSKFLLVPASFQGNRRVVTNRCNKQVHPIASKVHSVAMIALDFIAVPIQPEMQLISSNSEVYFMAFRIVEVYIGRIGSMAIFSWFLGQFVRCNWWQRQSKFKSFIFVDLWCLCLENSN